jgi:hypothetical protein
MSTNNFDTDEDTVKKLELLCERSKSLLEVQSSIFDQTRQNSTAILTLLAVFLPFFLNGLTDSLEWVKYLSLVPVLLILAAMLIFLITFRTQEFDRGFSNEKFQDLVNEPYKTVLVYDLSSNTDSYRDNKSVVSKMRKKYSLALALTYVAVVSSAAILLLNEFHPAVDKVTEVHLTNKLHMANTPQPPIQLPKIPSRDRERIEKGNPSGPISPPRPTTPPSK